MKRIQFALAPLTMAGAIILAGCEGTPSETLNALEGLHEDHSGHVMNSRPSAAQAAGAPDLAMIRAGSARYRNEGLAIADGFVDVSGCVEAPAGIPLTGAMGHHYVNFERLGDIGVDPASPEILLYLPDARGRMELVGVEFAVNAEAWHALHGAAVFPEVAGVRFDPPNPAADNPIVQTSYTLHVWNWTENPYGMFAPFNSALSCPVNGA
jgi:hypothetical protein